MDKTLSIHGLYNFNETLAIGFWRLIHDWCTYLRIFDKNNIFLLTVIIGLQPGLVKDYHFAQTFRVLRLKMEYCR